MQRGKSLAHLTIQHHLKSLIPPLELEKRIDRRVADAVWEEEKLVFEIQCSPMSFEEARNRCNDYQRQGYQVVWLLHDRHFNRKKLSAMESYVRKAGKAFFTDGYHIYDQSEVDLKNYRLFRGPRLSVAIDQPRRANGTLSFQGDFLHWARTHDTTFLDAIKRRHLRNYRWWKRVYKFLICKLLERSTL